MLRKCRKKWIWIWDIRFLSSLENNRKYLDLIFKHPILYQQPNITSKRKGSKNRHHLCFTFPQFLGNQTQKIKNARRIGKEQTQKSLLGSERVPQRRDIRVRRQGKREPRCRFSERSDPFSGTERYDQRETGAPPWPTSTPTSSSRRLFFLRLPSPTSRSPLRKEQPQTSLKIFGGKLNKLWSVCILNFGVTFTIVGGSSFIVGGVRDLGAFWGLDRTAGRVFVCLVVFQCLIQRVWPMTRPRSVGFGFGQWGAFF